jgi:hypothetical protein
VVGEFSHNGVYGRKQQKQGTNGQWIDSNALPAHAHNATRMMHDFAFEGNVLVQPGNMYCGTERERLDLLIIFVCYYCCHFCVVYY